VTCDYFAGQHWAIVLVVTRFLHRSHHQLLKLQGTSLHNCVMCMLAVGHCERFMVNLGEYELLVK